MKIKFNHSLDYQLEAINAVTYLFTGTTQNDCSKFDILSKNQGISLNEFGFANSVNISKEDIFSNLLKIQERNSILLDRSKNDTSRCEFSVEMETGTGKTYIYLRSIFELSKRYGLKKFIVVVPSIAVREGVLKTISLMTNHLNALYERPSFRAFVYDSDNLNNVREFACSKEVNIMIINIQSFSKDILESSELSEENLKKTNIMNRTNDRMLGYKPMEFIASTNPIVIIDEPQSVDNTTKAKSAIAKLNPLMTLRYSATHNECVNLIYSLDAVKAYRNGLVKRIEIASVLVESDLNEAYLKFISCDEKKNEISACIEIYKEFQSGAKFARIFVKKSDDLYKRSGYRETYKTGCIIQNIDRTPNNEYIELSSGKLIRMGEDKTQMGEELMKTQIRVTIEQHLKKEKRLLKLGIKVLSLFFIDRVSNYRIYHPNGDVALGKIGRWFEEIYESFIREEEYSCLRKFTASEVHNGYFAKDRLGKAKDSTGKSKDDGDVYALIMKDKERLLNPDEPLRFIFSHTALKEGWDNPNIFQICILREVGSEMERRQQIGRGLRLCVNADGDRITDRDVNRLTIIARESYENFANALQEEFREAGILIDKEDIKNAKERTTVKLHHDILVQDATKALWNAISQRTYYEIDDFDRNDFILKVVNAIDSKKREEVIAAAIMVSRTEISSLGNINEGIKRHRTNRSVSATLRLPDIISYLTKETSLTRQTVTDILTRCQNLDLFLNSPTKFMLSARDAILNILSEVIIKNIKYLKIDGKFWEISRFEKDAKEGIERYLSNLYLVKNNAKSLFNYIECDSLVEKSFATELDDNDSIELFLKLPSWFKIETPVGNYTPDWAFVYEAKKTIYFVCETKGSTDLNQLSSKERQKITCGEKHFEAIKAIESRGHIVRWEVVKSLEELLRRLDWK